MENGTGTTNGADNLNERRKRLIIKIMRVISVYLISICIVFGGLAGTAIVSYHSITSPVSIVETENIEVVIPRGATTARIADILESEGLIKSSTFFKFYVDLSGQGRNMRAGTYELNPSMTVKQIMDDIVSGSAMVETVRVTIREGTRLSNIAKVLKEAGAIKSEEDFLNIAQNEAFKEYVFLGEDNVPFDRVNRLEGYLFPDTYEFYLDSRPEQVIRRMLNNFQSKLYDENGSLKQEYKEALEKLNMTLDDAIILASVIQMESREREFHKVSAVFHNRLRDGQALESCATINYILDREVNTWTITYEETRMESPYNTYINRGLPIGPIGAPSEKAIIAAIMPDEEFLEAGYKYFVLKDPETGEHAFARTHDEHINNRRKYEQNWR